MYRKVAEKFSFIMQRGLAAAWRAWTDVVTEARANNNRAAHHFRMWVLFMLPAWLLLCLALPSPPQGPFLALFRDSGERTEVLEVQANNVLTLPSSGVLPMQGGPSTPIHL